MNKEDKDFQWRQFCKLGEMIGDGLHYEEPWISREYNKLLKILLPATKEEKDYKRNVRKLRNENIDKQIFERLKKDKCKCGSELKQTRRGSKVVKCTKIECSKKYTYKSKKKHT